MQNFGFLDEELLEETQVAELNEILRVREKTGDFPILLENEFLDMIYNKEEEPSITEMGLNYKAYLREQERHSSKKKGQEPEEVDENVKILIYEIGQRLASTAAVCSGSTSTAFPILTSYAVKGNLKGLHVSKKRVEETVKELKSIDFSVFYRETVLKMGEDIREIIEEEVDPYIILLPIYGTRPLLWQELSGTNKRSRGRLVMPIFFMGDLKKAMAQAFASFRWELTRTMKGGMWADPIEGGLTGEYFDYVNTYKKMSKLSGEAKEKIKIKFKSLRTNRDRFADDYLMWVMFEKDGIMKVNSVVRQMFYKHIPFNKEIRARLENMPAFSEDANRYANIHKRVTDGFERKFRKYKDDKGNYPETIQKFFEFLDK